MIIKLINLLPYRFVTALLFDYIIFKEMGRNLTADTQDIVWAVPLIVFGSLIFIWICCCCICVCYGPSSDMTARPSVVVPVVPTVPTVPTVSMRGPATRYPMEEDPV